MIKELVSMYKPSYPRTLVYMLQSAEYEVRPYIEWVHRTKDFSTVSRRRDLKMTRPAKMLLAALKAGIALQIILGLLLIILGATDKVAGGIAFGLSVIIVYPFVWPYLLVLPIILGRYLINRPLSRQAIVESKHIFAGHPGIKIAVVGSYGKTSMKELLNTVLSSGMKTAATPANKNVSISHAQFAKKLNGSEDVLIIEYGEGQPGDVENFARITSPTHAVITGLAPAHLDKYKTLNAAGKDIFSVASYLGNKNVYVYGDSKATEPFIKNSFHVFNHKEALGWKISDVETDLTGTSFVMKKGKEELRLKSGMVGKHQVGYLAFASALGLELGLSKSQIKEAIASTSPFEHRLQPYRLNGAWIVDDTYNGNLEGIRAGTALLKDLKAKRKIYVTPGLVDQGEENERVHKEIGRLIANASPDVAVIMKNSVTEYIRQGLEEAGFKGELRIEADPLEFYTNLNHFVADGDLVVMQNDWPDNYF